VPHVVILYTANIDQKTDMTRLCRALADELLSIRDESGNQPYPTPGTRVFAIPAPHFAVADGKGDYAFVYINVRLARGRSDTIKETTGDRLLAKVKEHLEAVLLSEPVGITLQMDESPGQVFDAKDGSLRKLFGR
jgi:5-carboxymethyl-2-hydroxymuconate isomerase